MSGRRDQHEADSYRRTEPKLGNLDRLDAPDVPIDDGLPHLKAEARAQVQKTTPRPEPGRQRQSRWLPALICVLVVLIGALWVSQNRLRRMLPRTEFNDVLGRAEQALQSGHLDGQDGTSARELFQAAAALEPDNDRAHDGLKQVGQAELSKADAALQAGNIDQAAQLAAVARELLGGGSDLDRLDGAINRIRATQVQASDLVDQAQKALAAGNLDGDQGASALYRRILQADPGNAVAMHGLDQVGQALATQAHKALDANDIAAANASIEQLAVLQPNNGELPVLRAQQAQATQARNAALDTALKQGMDALRSGRISGTDGDTALAHFKAALALDPSNADAKDGLGRVAQALTVQANAAIDAGDSAQASQLLEQAAALAPKSADLAAAQARLAGVATAAAAAPSSAGASPPTPAILTPQQSAAVASMVQHAQEAAARGDIMLPPGGSAYDLYRNALAIDSNNNAAMQGLQLLPARVQSQFNQALSNGNLAQAGQMLGNLAELSPGDAAQNALSGRLADAWLDQAEQQLSQGNRSAAMQSLDQARKLAPTHPRVVELTARLQGSL